MSEVPSSELDHSSGRKRVYIFVGPKGAGKSFLAERVAAQLGFHFLRVEEIWMAVKLLGLANEEFEREGSLRVLAAIRSLFDIHDQLIIESIGASNVFSRQLSELQKIADVLLVRIRAPLELCLERVRSRDPATHINLSDEHVIEINRVAGAFEREWDLEFDNSAGNGAEAFCALFATAFRLPGAT